MREGGKFLESLILTSLHDDKAEDVDVVNLAGKSSFADAMIVASGTSQRHLSSIAEHLVERLSAAGIRGVGVEGKDQSSWVLIDAGDIIVHLFRPETRELYSLEKMWAVPLSRTREALV